MSPPSPATVLVLVLHLSLALQDWTTAAATAGNNSSNNNSSNNNSNNNNMSDEHLATEVDLFVRHLMDCHLSPALTLALVKDGHVVLAKGYGFTSTNKTHPVSSKTKFAIGSLTKAFTTTLVAKWVHEQDGNITLDTPIASFYPEFRVSDQLRSGQASLRDLLSHRMGLPSYFIPLLVGFPADVTRDRLAQQMAFMPDDQLTFRNKFSYNNYMYTVAAHLLEKMSGRTWEDLTRDTLLVPLNMSQTGFIDKLDNFSDFALPCAMVNASLVDLSTDLFSTVSPCGPAGSLYSNAEDMARWMTFQLAEGKGSQGQQVIAPEVLKMTREPGMLFDLPFDEMTLPHSSVSHVAKSYDLGWVTAYYRGYKQIFHTGGFITHSSRLWLFPDVNVGVYVNVNGPQSRDNKNNLLESLMYFASDQLLGREPWLEKTAVCQTLIDLEQGPATPVSSTTSTSSTPQHVTELGSPTADSANVTQHQGTEAMHQLSIAGNYSNPCFGTIEISMHEHTTPRFRFGRYGEMDMYAESPLRYLLRFTGHLSYLSPPSRPSGYLLKFTLDTTGQVDGLLMTLDPEASLVKFDLQTGESNSHNSRNSGSTLLVSILPNVLAPLLMLVFDLLPR